MANIRPLNEELQKIADSELHEVPSRVAEDIAAFRAWITKQAHLNGRTDDQHLISFLRGTKYSLERAKKKYDLFYTMRSTLPEVFKDRDPKLPKNLELIRKGLILPLRKTATPDSPRIFIVRKTLYDPALYSIQDAFRIVTMMNDLCLLTDDNYVVAGQESLIDMTGTSLGHLGQMSPRFAKTATLVAQDASPIRMKGSHYVHTPMGFQTIFNLFKPFLSEKTKQRIHVHGSDFEAVLTHLPKELLPKEYGGDDGTIQDLIDYWEAKFMEHRQYLIDFEQYGVDESKRSTTPTTDDKLDRVEGTFRKLELE